MKRIRELLVAAVALSLTATACSSPSEPASDGQGSQPYASGGTFTMVIAEDPGNLDPAMTVLGVTRTVASFAYDRLLAFDADGTLHPWLATDWSVTPTSVTYTLRDDVTCADGSPLTATDVADNFSFIADPANKSPLIGTFVPAGLVATADETANTVTLETENPEAFLLENTGGNVFIVCKAGMADRSLLEHETFGTGMFTLTEQVAGDHYTFTKRDDYTWGNDDVTSEEVGLPDTAILKVVENETTAANLLLGGEVHAARVSGMDRERLDNQDLFVRETGVILGEMFFNQAPGRPGEDENVRRALSMALDLDDLGQVITGGRGTPSKSLVTLAPNVCQSDAVQGSLPSHDPTKAAVLLDDAGWVKGSDGIRSKDGNRLSFTFIYLSADGESVAAGAELLAQRWQDLGAEVELQGLSQTALSPIIFDSGAWDAGWVPFGVGLPNVLVPFFSGANPPDGTNFAHIDNPEYDALVSEATTLTGDAACEKWTAAEAALVEQVDVVPFVDRTLPTFGSGAEFEAVGGSVNPLTIRMLSD